MGEKEGEEDIMEVRNNLHTSERVRQEGEKEPRWHQSGKRGGFQRAPCQEFPQKGLGEDFWRIDSLSLSLPPSSLRKDVFGRKAAGDEGRKMSI